MPDCRLEWFRLVFEASVCCVGEGRQSLIRIRLVFVRGWIVVVVDGWDHQDYVCTRSGESTCPKRCSVGV